MNWIARIEAALDPALSITIEDERYLGDEGHRAAAVLIPITDRSEPGVILTQRPEWLRSHAGQVAFPGGKVDEVDADAISAALREANEELNISPSDVQVIGVPDIRYGEEIMAWVKLKDDAESVTDEDLRAYCRGKIAHYKIPRYIKMVSEFPMTVTGKVRKIEMREVSIDELGLHAAAAVKNA